MEESQLLGTQHIGTEHILLGLIREEEGMACKILENLGLNLTHVRDSILNYIGDAEPGDLTEDLSADNPEETTRETSRSAQTKKKSKTSSSIKIMASLAAAISSIMFLSRCSNSPRYLVPATTEAKSNASKRLPFNTSEISPRAIFWASPSTIAVLPAPGSFQPITVDPPDVEQTITILKGIRAKYEQHHKVKYADDALQAAAAIADRYITDRAMPDKAIDLFDEAGARARLKNAVLPPEIKEKQKEYNQAVEEKDQALANKEFEKAAAAKDTEDRLKNYIDHLKKKWQEEREQKQPEVTKEDIALVASKWTGIPVTRLTQSETDKILHMEEHLHERIIGQEEAVRAVSQAIRRNRTGLGNPNRPIGGFLFLGPTGVGKTELAKSLASFLFGDEDAMIRLDMSEYMEKFAVSRLIGAPPGYVGYEEGGQLTEAVRRRPYSVVVLDELEKAHPDIYNILLQVLDEGYLSDTLGHKVSFKNCVVIMTSNVGAREITNKGSNLGFAAKTTEEQQYQDMRQGVMDEVKKTFNPEFINRIDEIVVFHALTKENIAQILDLALEEVDDKLANKELELELTDSAKNYLIERGFDAKYGARPLLRTLQRELEDPLAENILTSRYAPGTVIRVDLNKDTQKLTFSNAASKPKNAVAI